MRDFNLEKAKAEQLNVVLAYVLWWFLGMFGAHRFYTKQKLGWLYIVLTLVGFLTSAFLIGIPILLGVMVWWIIDAVKLNNVVKMYNLEVLEKYQEREESRNETSVEETVTEETSVEKDTETK